MSYIIQNSKFTGTEFHQFLLVTPPNVNLYNGKEFYLFIFKSFLIFFEINFDFYYKILLNNSVFENRNVSYCLICKVYLLNDE